MIYLFKIIIITIIYYYCVCVCENERERERISLSLTLWFFHQVLFLKMSSAREIYKIDNNNNILKLKKSYCTESPFGLHS